ncbi:MAG: CDP-glycerol glycerophosphotransferase family protein [Bacilli bacterium]|jgi:CDP-glycerol glycerophosphotransferase (TagB/SpsB family)
MNEFIRLIIGFPLYYFSFLSFRKKNRIIFGAWNGLQFSDNSKYLFQYILKEKPGYDLIWCGKSFLKLDLPLNKRVKFVKINSFKAYYFALTSKYAFVTHGYEDIVNFNVFGRAKLVQLWHGIGIKNVGELDQNGNRFIGMLKKKVRCFIRRYDYFICSSKLNKKRNMKAFASYGAKKEKMIESGQPRNDFLINQKENLKIRNEILKRYNIPIDLKIITYLPTFRKNSDKYFSFLNLEGEFKDNLMQFLKGNKYIILEKSHISISDSFIQEGCNDRIINLNNFKNVNTQEILLITDLLITDYSSCYIDYLLLNRPIIHYVYDYLKYKKEEQGLYFNLDDIAGGVIIEDINELLNTMKEELLNPQKEKERRKKIKTLMLEFEKGNSCKKICKKLEIV